LAHGEEIRLHAVVKAGQHAGNYEVVTATIPGADAKLKEEEIAFSCHLDHQRPGANDNASGCVTILEVARTLEKFINEAKLARPADDSVYMAAGSGRDDGAAECEAGDGEADQGGSPHGHGGRGAGDEGSVPPDTRADELAEFCA
jgi:hypothetical protein